MHIYHLERWELLLKISSICLRLRNCTVCLAHRSRNKVDHYLAKWALPNDGEYVWLEEAHPWLNARLVFIFNKFTQPGFHSNHVTSQVILIPSIWAFFF